MHTTSIPNPAHIFTILVLITGIQHLRALPGHTEGVSEKRVFGMPAQPKRRWYLAYKEGDASRATMLGFAARTCTRERDAHRWYPNTHASCTRRTAWRSPCSQPPGTCLATPSIAQPGSPSNPIWPTARSSSVSRRCWSMCWRRTRHSEFAAAERGDERSDRGMKAACSL